MCATPRSGPVVLRRLPSERRLGPGQLVALNPGALYAGYEGGVGRTIAVEGVSRRRVGPRGALRATRSTR